MEFNRKIWKYKKKCAKHVNLGPKVDTKGLKHFFYCTKTQTAAAGRKDNSLGDLPVHANRTHARTDECLSSMKQHTAYVGSTAAAAAAAAAAAESVIHRP